MLVGTADVGALARGAPKLEDFKTDSLELADVEVLKLVYEIESASAESLLPPALHPTLPPLVSWLGYRAATSPWGPFALAQTRVECRSGARPRAFLVGAACDNPDAAQALAARWGYRVSPAEVTLERGYERSSLRVAFDGRPALTAGLLDPAPLAPGDVQYIANMNLAETPRGLRLVQVDPEVRAQRAERGTPWLDSFDAAAWGGAGIVPAWPVAASLCRADVVLPRLRFVCHPEQMAFQGTERAD